MTESERRVETGDYATLDIDPDEDPHFEEYDGALVEIMETYNHVAEVLRVVDRNESRMNRRLTGPVLSIPYGDLEPVEEDNA